MTNRFKEAQAIVDKLPDFIMSEYFKGILYEALTLAQEAEQLRKERDELARNLLHVAECGDVIDVKIFELAKKGTENENTTRNDGIRL